MALGKVSRVLSESSSFGWGPCCDDTRRVRLVRAMSRLPQGLKPHGIVTVIPCAGCRSTRAIVRHLVDTSAEYDVRMSLPSTLDGNAKAVDVGQ
jgi:hypothetical protein